MYPFYKLSISRQISITYANMRAKQTKRVLNLNVIILLIE